MSNLSKYAALHRLTTELNTEVGSSTEAKLSDDQQVIAAVGGAVMALGMGLAELATTENMTAEQTSILLEAANTLSVPTAEGFQALVNVAETLPKEDMSAAMAKDLSTEVESVDVFVMGLMEVGAFYKARPKPEPLVTE